MMGSPPDELERRPDEAQVEVTLTKGFWTAKFEATQGQWKRIVGELPDRLPRPVRQGRRRSDVLGQLPRGRTVLRELTERARGARELPGGWDSSADRSAVGVRLPCRHRDERSRSATRSSTRSVANFGEEWRQSDPVGSYPANAWGIHDMHGNVWEWCRDYYHARGRVASTPTCRKSPAW